MQIGSEELKRPSVTAIDRLVSEEALNEERIKTHEMAWIIDQHNLLLPPLENILKERDNDPNSNSRRSWSSQFCTIEIGSVRETMAQQDERTEISCSSLSSATSITSH
mgnify:CR=1 FL=1|jgi:hypothetical protein